MGALTDAMNEEERLMQWCGALEPGILNDERDRREQNFGRPGYTGGDAKGNTLVYCPRCKVKLHPNNLVAPWDNAKDEDHICKACYTEASVCPGEGNNNND